MRIKSILKKLLFSFIILLLFITTVKAFSNNLKEVNIVETNMGISNVSVNDNMIVDDLIFNDVGDYIILNFKLSNNDDYKYKIEEIIDDNKTNNIVITYDYSKEEIDKKSEYEFNAKLEYKNRLENVDKIDINDLKITIKLLRDDGKTKDIIIKNPKTQDSILHYLVLLIISLIGLILIRVKKKKFIGYPLLIILCVFLLPLTIFAYERFEYDILLKHISIKGVMLPYNVNFHVLDKEPTTKVVIYGQEIGEYPEVNENGYEFIEWQDRTGNKVDEHTIVTGETDVYAKLELIPYTIIYDLNGGSLEDGKENLNVYFINSDDITLNNPVKEGYNFSGWTGSNGNVLQTNVTINKGTTGNLSFIANYLPREDTLYKVIHRKQKLTLDEYEESDTDILRGVTDTIVRPETKNYNGFISPEERELLITADGNAVLIYDYNRRYYNYGVDENTISSHQEGSYPYETEITVSPKEIEGYTFDKWSDDNTDSTRTIILDRDITDLKPIYKANGNTPYTVIHKFQNLDLITYTEEIENKQGETDADVTPGIKIREGFERPALITGKIKSDGTLVITYIYNRLYYNFTLEDPDNTNSTKITGSYPYETEISVSPKEIEGYTFDRWNDGDENSNKTIVLTHDISIKPIYKTNKYNIVFNNNTGSGIMPDQEINYDEDTKLNKNTFTKTGYTFDKWNTKDDGSGTSYNDEEIIKNLATSGNKILYAIWKANDLIFDNQTLQNGVYGTLYTSSFEPATNGTEDYTYIIKNGEPAGTTIDSLNRTITLPINTIGGTYNIVITARDNNTGKTKDATMTITIDEATPIVTLIGKSEVYKGTIINANSPDVEPNSNPEIIYTYYNGADCSGSPLDGAPRNSGLYSVIAHANPVTNKTKAADSNCVSHIITKSDTTTSISPIIKTYNGISEDADTAISILNSNNNLIDLGEFNYTYYNGNNCEGSPLTNPPSLAGTYSFKATLVGTSNYNTSTSECALYVINKKAITIKAKDQTIDYGNTISNTINDVIVSSLISGDNLAEIILSQSTDNPTLNGTIIPSNAKINNDITDVSSSYDITYNNGNLIINKLTDNIIITSKEYIYDGTYKSVDAASVSGSPVSLTYYTDNECNNKTTTENAGSIGGAPNKVGEYYVTGRVDESDYYNSATYSCNKVLTINNAKITFNPNDGTLNGSDILYTRNGDINVYTGIRNSTIGTIPTASKEAHLFKGWYTDPVNGQKVLNEDGSFTGTIVNGYTSTNKWSLTENKTLYAHYASRTSTLDTGRNVNYKLKTLSGASSPNINTVNNNINSIVRTTTRPDISTMTNNNIISTSDSTIPIYAWFDNNTGTIYYYSEEETIYMNPSSEYIFMNLSTLRNVDLATIDTSKVTNMAYMFYKCNDLASLDLSKFDTSNVTDMGNMFYDCQSLTELDVTKFDTKNVTSMSAMFLGCLGLTSLDVTKFDTSNVTNMYGMFFNCKNLTSLDVTKFITSNVTNMSAMFYSCNNVASLDVTKFDTRNVTDMSFMFSGCTSLTELDVTKFVTDNVTNMASMFSYCNNLASLDVTKFVTDNVTNMSFMFNACFALTSLDVSKFVTNNVTDMHYMFCNCNSLTSIDVSKFVTSNVTDMSQMFHNCSSLTELDVSKFDTRNVTNMHGMFYECSELTSLDVSKFVTSNVTDMSFMFCQCSKLTSLDLSKFDTRNVTNMVAMFNMCVLLTELDVSSFVTNRVTDMSNMFDSCIRLTTIYASNNFVTTNANSSLDMFRNDAYLVGEGGTTFDSNYTDKTYARIDGGTSNPGYFTYKEPPAGASISVFKNMFNGGNKIILIVSSIIVIVLGMILLLAKKRNKKKS